MQKKQHQVAKHLMRAAVLGALATSTATMASAADTLRTYPVPKELMYRAHNDDFTVRVRNSGGEWQDLYEYNVQVDTDTKKQASLVYFDFTGTVEVEVMKNNGTVRDVAIAPLSSAIRLQRVGPITRLSLDKPESFSLQFDDDRLRNLHIIAGKPPQPRPAGANVRYFGPGLHTPAGNGDTFPVKSGERIYLEGGAVLLGAFDLSRVNDVRIAGRGLLWDPGRAIDLERARDVEVADLILVNGDRKDAARVMNIRNSRDVTVRDITAFTSGKWSDGINISTSQNVTVDGGYLRVSDDAVVVYAVADCPLCRQREVQTGVKDPMPSGDTTNIDIRNLRIWNDVAHALYVGHFGDTSQPRTISDVRFSNIDIMNLDEDDPDWEGAMAIYSGDSTLVRNVSFTNIRVDRIEEGKLIHIAAGNNARYNKAPGRGIDGVTLRHISFTGDGMPSDSIITGISPDTSVRNVAIEGLRIGGRRVTSAKDGNIRVGPFVSGLTIR